MKKIVLGGFAFVGGAVMYSIGTLGFAHVEVQANCRNRHKMRSPIFLHDKLMSEKHFVKLAERKTGRQ